MLSLAESDQMREGKCMNEVAELSRACSHRVWAAAKREVLIAELCLVLLQPFEHC